MFHFESIYMLKTADREKNPVRVRQERKECSSEKTKIIKAYQKDKNIFTNLP